MGVGISLSGLASAVANEGGIGVIAANAIGMIEPDYFENGIEANMRALRNEIRKARQLTTGIIGVNIMLAINDFQNMLRVAIEERVDIVFLGAGLPLKGIPVKELRDSKVKIVPIVSSARAARLIFSYWQKNYGDVPDGLVVEGPEAGGHLGFKLDEIHNPDYSLEKIIPQVIEAVIPFKKDFDKAIPVIAAGGIFTGEDIFKFIELGAAGVQMASRFVATHECDADYKFKEAYINCKAEDIVIIVSPVGMPGRAIKNNFIDEVNSDTPTRIRCPWRCLSSCKAQDARYCISEALNNARLGNLDNGYAFAGSNAPRIDRIVHVKDIFTELTHDYLVVVEKNTVSLRNEFEKGLKKLNGLLDEYKKTVEGGIKSLKLEFDQAVEKGAAAFREEYNHAAARIESIKAEYSGHVEKVLHLKEQLSRFFDTSSVVVPVIIA